MNSVGGSNVVGNSDAWVVTALVGLIHIEEVQNISMIRTWVRFCQFTQHNSGSLCPPPLWVAGLATQQTYIQGYLAHKKTHPPQDLHRALGMWLLDSHLRIPCRVLEERRPNTNSAPGYDPKDLKERSHAGSSNAGSLRTGGGVTDLLKANSFKALFCSEVWYKGTSVTRKRPPPGPYRRPMRRVLGGVQGGGRFFVGEVPLYKVFSLRLWYLIVVTALDPQNDGLGEPYRGTSLM